MKGRGLLKVRRRRNAERAGVQRAMVHFETREVRSYEAAYVGGLWHLDFHHCSRKIVTPSGEWLTPVVLAILDDYSRLLCHIQWYLSEQAEDLVHGTTQAFQKRGLPRGVLMDNGSAMGAQEVTEGFERLGIPQHTTLPYSPYQNGKQEIIWSSLEGRCLAMLEGVEDLTLSFLNYATQAWAELEYNRTVHDETGEKPLDRFLGGPSVLRPSPPGEVLRNAFRIQARRRQRLSDGTISVEGVRFEVPSRFRHLERLAVQYARWDLRSVHLLDERTGVFLAPLYPLDRTANADGRRRSVEPVLSELPEVPPSPEIPPLLRKLLREYSATGLPPAYIPKPQTEDQGDRP